MERFHTFEMEREMSRFEQTVDYNLSESGVHPMSLGELLDLAPSGAPLEALLGTKLNYPYANGDPELREAIAALYEAARPENVLVTTGAAEANYNAVRTVASGGDEVVVMLPNYMQIWGIAKNHGLAVREFHLREENGWAPDLDELDGVVSPRTRLIAVCNPNNPTGRILTQEEMDRIVDVADRAGAWILADEVYRGATRVGDVENPSFHGRYDKVLAVGSMSKAYGLPGLRIGWVVAPPSMIEEIWKRHEYTTISATMLSNRLAALALSEGVRPRLLRRTREYIRSGYRRLEDWLGRHPGLFSVVPPDAAAIAFPRYAMEINSSEFADRLRVEKSVFIVPGDHFGLDRFVRVSFGLPAEVLLPALDRIHDLICEIEDPARG